MANHTAKSAYVLSVIIAALAFVASAGGLFLASAYRDNILVTAAFRGNDLVTLVAVVPLLIVALFLARRGSPRGQLVWMGLLAYMLYNYAFYLFGAALNRFFLIYVALFSLSIYALIFGLAGLDVVGIAKKFRPGTPVKWISGYILVFAFLLGGMWMARWLSFALSGQVPTDIVQTGHPTGMVYALDLSLLIPNLVLAGIWLWQRRSWGYVLASIMMVKGATYGLALIAMSPFAAAAGVPGAWDLAALWAVLGVGCLLAALLLLVNCRPARTPSGLAGVKLNETRVDVHPTDGSPRA